jgi:hypothetical protein
MHKERLLRLVDLLNTSYDGNDRGDPGNGRRIKFHMPSWITASKSGSEVDLMTCSTAACACGSAALNPWFREQGLGLTHLRGAEWDITYGGKRNMAAAAAFFDIDIDIGEASALFNPMHYDDLTPSAKTVAGRICNFVHSGKIT